jgi:thiol-disulfide isomerase/thioredoxin
VIERAVVVVFLVLATLAVALLGRWRAGVRTAAAEGRLLPGAVLSRFPADAAGILYFYGPHCGSCRQQAAILDQLVGRDAVTVIPLDAVAQADLADSLGIATVPATVVVGPGGVVRSVNLGLRSLQALAGQLEQAVGSRVAA